MPVNLSGRNFLKLLDFTTEEIEYLIKLSKEFKNLKLTNTPHKYLAGKNIVLLFERLQQELDVHSKLQDVT